ncbi:MAG TPA: hypothetical protein VHP35_16760, partial [Terriglobia bacterium]|nr:hypothetical protein [Terriglobia bacterium]
QLYLRIIPRLFPNTRFPFGPSHLGYAATSEEGGVLATIFFHRVEAPAWGDPSFALGSAIAHELGHLLLGNGRGNGGPHSASGLMRAHWQRDDLKRKTRETMQFRSEDADRCEPGSWNGSVRALISSRPHPFSPKLFTYPLT